MLERGRVAMIMGTTICTMATFAGGPGGAGQRSTYYAPTFPAESVLTISFDRIQAYAQKLTFDTVLGAAHELPVDFKRGEVGTERAPLIKIQPETASYKLLEKDLEQGRIIGRLSSAAEVSRLSLGSGWTWWWVDKKGRDGGWRSVFIPASEKAGPRTELARPLTLTYHRPGPWRQSIAQFRVVNVPVGDHDPVWIQGWGTCGGCCRQLLLMVTAEP
jgi:hypothetical protein